MNALDLQIQTTVSDGKHTPTECVRMAKENGVHTIVITDHDTVAGVAEAFRAGEAMGVRVIPGIEMSVQDHGMHLLGLGIDTEDATLHTALAQASESRTNAAREMVRRFQAGGFAVDWEDVLREAGNAIMTRPHIVAAIMKRPENKERIAGIATKHDFFEKYFQDTSPFYVRGSQVTAEQAIRLVRGAGGVAVWSHPPIPDFVGKCDELEAFLCCLIGWGLDGIELCGPFLTDADFACLEKLAARYGLVRTAGSDFHEAAAASGKPWPRSAGMIGDFPAHGVSLEGIIEKLDQAMARRQAERASGAAL